MLFHLLNCLNCGKICFFLFFLVESGEKTVDLLYTLHYLFLFLQLLFPCVLQTIFGKYVSQDITVTMSCSSPQVIHEMILVQRKRPLKKNFNWTFEIYHGNRCQVFTWNEINFGKWGNPQQADLLKRGFEDCQVCSNRDKKQTLFLHL